MQKISDNVFLEIICEPPTAEVYIDDVYMGQVDGWQLGIIPIDTKSHRLVLKKEGYYSYRMDIHGQSGDTMIVNATLYKRPAVTIR